MLLGIGVRPWIDLNGRVTTNDDTLAAYQTVYGWTVEGSLPSKSKTQTIQSLHIASVNVEHDISRDGSLQFPSSHLRRRELLPTLFKLTQDSLMVATKSVCQRSMGTLLLAVHENWLSNATSAMKSLCSAKASGMLISKEFWNTSAWNMQSRSQGRTCVSQKTFVFICLCMVFIRPVLQPPSYGWYVMPQHLQAMEDP